MQENRNWLVRLKDAGNIEIIQVTATKLEVVPSGHLTFYDNDIVCHVQSFGSWKDAKLLSSEADTDHMFVVKLKGDDDE